MKLGKKTILIAGIPVGLAVAGGLAFTMLSGPAGPPPQIPDPAEGQHGVMLVLDDKVVNLLPAGGSSYRYAKVGVTVEIRPEKADFYALKAEARKTAEELLVKDYEANVPLLLDALGRVVSARTAEQMSTPESRSELKNELADAFREVLGEREVLDVYFTELVMQ
jgi:flagellar basal body-associated protein FliL